MNIEVLIIAVLYKTYNECQKLINSILNQNSISDVRVIIVDNSSELAKNEFIEQFNKPDSDIQYISAPQNLGYFGGAQFGYSHFISTNPVPNKVIVCNVDVVLEQSFFFQKLIELKLDDNIGIVAPSIISKRYKTDANPKIEERYSLKKMKFYRLINSNMFFINFYQFLSYCKKIIKLKPAKKIVTAKYIYAPHGAFIIFTKEYFVRGGSFKHFSFLFGEEIFVAETASKLNLKVLYNPELIISDFEHASTGIFYKPIICRYMKISTLDIINHYYSA